MYLLVFLGSTPVFAPLVGWVAEVAGARASLWMGGAVSVAAAVAAYALRASRQRRNVAPLPLRANLRLASPSPKLARRKFDES
ncbi:hypothetical protein GCM10029992_16420 [Glycomyces albus]